MKNTYTAAQLKLLRHRLKAHRGANPGEGRAMLSWQEVSLDIADITGTAVPAERLRQFVEGSSRKSGKGPSMLSPDRLRAVRDFLLNDEIALIDSEEWDAQPRAGYISIMVRIPLEDVLNRGAAALPDHIELDPMALVIDDGNAEQAKESEDDHEQLCAACSLKLA